MFEVTVAAAERGAAVAIGVAPPAPCAEGAEPLSAASAVALAKALVHAPSSGLGAAEASRVALFWASDGSVTVHGARVTHMGSQAGTFGGSWSTPRLWPYAVGDVVGVALRPCAVADAAGPSCSVELAFSHNGAYAGAITIAANSATGMFGVRARAAALACAACCALTPPPLSARAPLHGAGAASAGAPRPVRHFQRHRRGRRRHRARPARRLPRRQAAVSCARRGGAAAAVARRRAAAVARRRRTRARKRHARRRL